MSSIIKYSILIFFVNFSSLISLIFVDDLKTQFIISIIGALLSVLTILYAKKKVSLFIKPPMKILGMMEIEPIPVAYEPNKFRKSSMILGYIPYLIGFSNLFSYLAYKFSVYVEQPYGDIEQIINDEYMLWSIMFMMIGFISFGLWAKLRQAYCVYSEKDDVYRGKLNAFSIIITEQAQKLNLYYQLVKKL